MYLNHTCFVHLKKIGNMDIYKCNSYQNTLRIVHTTRIMASGPITSWQIDGKTVETVADLFWGASKSLQMVTIAMKLRRLLLGRKVMTNLYSIFKIRDITLQQRSI